MKSRKFVALACFLVCVLACFGAVSARLLRGTAPLPTPTRILLVGYGQSNMDEFFQASSSPPAAVAGTSFYDCSTDPSPPCGITSVPAADGLRILQNTVTNVTGLPTLSMVCAVGGSSLNGLLSGINNHQTGYQGCINQVMANIRPTDAVFFLWDQGETDSAGTPEAPDYYAPTVAQLHYNLAAAIGRTIFNAPWITTSKGVVVCTGCVVNTTWFQGNATMLSWHVLTNSLKAIPSYDPGAVWFNQYDYNLGGDGLHYIAAHGTAFGGPRFATYVINSVCPKIGCGGSVTGPPTFEPTSASVIDATDTAVNVTHSLGTDYTPASSASGTNAFEVSGDNGVTWNPVSTTHTSATQIKLTHASLTTTNARLVRHLYGPSPPDTVTPCSVSPCSGPSNLTFDNSSLAIPLSPTTWPLRASGGTTLPMPTWRDVVATDGSGHQLQNAKGIQLGPEHVRKQLIFSLVGTSLNMLSLTIIPKDFLGNPVGSSITLSNPSPIVLAGTSAPAASFYSVTLNANNANASLVDIDINFNGDPFQGNIVQAWTVPFSDLNSTTPTGFNGSNTASSTSGTTTLTASAGGFILAAAASTSTMTASGTAYNFVGTDASSASIPMAIRWLTPSGIQGFSGDGANVTNAGTATVTANFLNSGTVNLAAVAFR